MRKINQFHLMKIFKKKGDVDISGDEKDDDIF